MTTIATMPKQTKMPSFANLVLEKRADRPIDACLARPVPRLWPVARERGPHNTANTEAQRGTHVFGMVV